MEFIINLLFFFVTVLDQPLVPSNQFKVVAHTWDTTKTYRVIVGISKTMDQGYANIYTQSDTIITPGIYLTHTFKLDNLQPDDKWYTLNIISISPEVKDIFITTKHITP